MSYGDAYATAATYRNRITKSDTGDDAAILVDLTSISRMIDHELGREFNKAGAPFSRIFVPDWPSTASAEAQRTLYVDDFDGAGTIEVESDDTDDGSFSGTTWTADTDYRPWPFNRTNIGEASEQLPCTGLWLPPNSTRSFTPGRLVQVTALWGWPVVPEPIESATIQLTAILRLEGPRSQATVSELGQVAQMHPTAVGIINRLKDRYARRAGVSI